MDSFIVTLMYFCIAALYFSINIARFLAWHKQLGFHWIPLVTGILLFIWAGIIWPITFVRWAIKKYNAEK